jgi:hypothetical protein
MRSYSKPLANKRWSYLMQLLTSDVPRRSTELPCASVRVAVATTLRGVLKKVGCAVAATKVLNVAVPSVLAVTLLMVSCVEPNHTSGTW